MPRHEFSGQAQLLIDKTTVTAHCLNISSDGILLSIPAESEIAAAGIRKSSHINLCIDSLPVQNLRAAVMHRNAGTIGLKFDTLIHSHIPEHEMLIDKPAKKTGSRFGLYQMRKQVWIQARRWSIFGINKFARNAILRAVQPGFLFAVYGNKRDVSRYISEDLHARLPEISLGNYISKGKFKGFVVASKSFEHELAEDSAKVVKYLDNLRKVWPSVNKVALVGRLPTFAMKARYPIEAPFVEGSLGTRFMILELAKELKARPEYQQETSIVVLGGAGRIGRALCDDLAKYFDQVIAFDRRYDIDFQSTEKILETSNPMHFGDHKLFIVLTARGSAVEEFLPFLPRGAILADDTHPSIETPLRQALRRRGIEVEKTVLTNPEFTAFPKMPQWSKGSIPGCLVEALVLLEEPEADKQTIEEFSKTAVRLGYKAQLVKPFTPE
ncbi:PilZ domain-containing protein [Allohahella sp. A8]|uniref:PilZ domain-containing protein n=1 Tax=Allohahella sp. A8 TaxID=3141461 RepID=UPI003A801F25|tara:strand:- start:24248 stop:25567 length:1320 start_codon:yes stop_codon:yes gene_type:complete